MNGGDRKLLALFELQDQLHDVLPQIELCSGLTIAVGLIKQALHPAGEEER